MNFSEALKAMKMGSKVSREAWRGKISYWEYNEENKCIDAYRPDGLSRPVVTLNLDEIFAEDWFYVT